MVRIEALYGVVHGAEAISLFGDRKPVFLKPSTEIQQMLHELPQGTSVGIEYHPDLPLVRIAGAYFSPETNQYWQQIEAICTQHKLPVIYLDDIALLVNYLKHIVRANDLEYLTELTEQREYLKSEGEFPDDEGWGTTEENLISIHDRRREAYCRRVIGQYILEVKREESLLANMVNKRPQVAILGRSHSDMLILDPSLTTRHNISVGAYHPESPDPSELLRRTLLIRRYNAVINGRVNPTGRPDYIGYFLEKGLPPEAGVFEVYTKKGGGFEGTIMDSLGDAKIVLGRLNADEVAFAKEYIPKQSDPHVSGHTIVYRGTRQGDQYVGEYAIGRYTNMFMMQPFSRNVPIFTPGVWS